MLRRLAVFCILQLLLCTAVVAQNPGDFMNMFSTLVRAAIIDHARREWSKFPLQEGSCIEQALQQQGYSIDLLVQNGIVPTDPPVSSIRSGCRLSAASLSSTTGDIENFVGISAQPTFDCAKARSATGRIGKYEDHCYMFGFVDDREFGMQREPFAVDCDGGIRAVSKWKVAEKFQSQWNAN